MLDKKATQLTNLIFLSLSIQPSTSKFVTIQPIILEALEDIYLQARRDQVDMVTFQQLPNGSLKFPVK